MNVLTDKDILEILNKMNIEIKGVYHKDLLPVLTTGFYVINLDHSTSGKNGTHWTALYFSPTTEIYFDPFGFPAPEEVEDKLKDYDYSKKEIQDINTSSCGYYCIAFIKFLYALTDKEKAFKLFLRTFQRDVGNNEAILYKLLYP